MERKSRKGGNYANLIASFPVPSLARMLSLPTRTEAKNGGGYYTYLFNMFIALYMSQNRFSIIILTIHKPSIYYFVLTPNNLVFFSLTPILRLQIICEFNMP
jgi:hypothetical protein